MLGLITPRPAPDVELSMLGALVPSVGICPMAVSRCALLMLGPGPGPGPGAGVGVGVGVGVGGAALVVPLSPGRRFPGKVLDGDGVLGFSSSTRPPLAKNMRGSSGDTRGEKPD